MLTIKSLNETLGYFHMQSNNNRLNSSRFGANITTVPRDIVVAEEPESSEPDFSAWSCEPKELQGLLDTYVVESRFPGRYPGTSLYLTVATRRNGDAVAMVPDQKFKLFMAPHSRNYWNLCGLTWNCKKHHVLHM